MRISVKHISGTGIAGLGDTPLLCRACPRGSSTWACYRPVRARPARRSFGLSSLLPRQPPPYTPPWSGVQTWAGLDCGWALRPWPPYFRVHAWHPVQSVLLPHQRGGASVRLLPQPLPDGRVPHAKCLPPAEPVRTGRPCTQRGPLGARGHCMWGAVPSGL